MLEEIIPLATEEAGTALADAPLADTGEPQRCVILVDAALPPGRAANAAAVIALTLGQRHPQLVGPALVDAAGVAHPGLIPIGITILAATPEEMATARDKALGRDLDVVAFPVEGQQTTDYAAFRAAVSWVETAALQFVGIGLYGPRKAVGRVVGRFGLFA
jgi:hypothetical protein